MAALIVEFIFYILELPAIDKAAERDRHMPLRAGSASSAASLDRRHTMAAANDALASEPERAGSARSVRSSVGSARSQRSARSLSLASASLDNVIQRVASPPRPQPLPRVAPPRLKVIDTDAGKTNPRNPAEKRAKAAAAQRQLVAELSAARAELVTAQVMLVLVLLLLLPLQPLVLLLALVLLLC